MWLIEEIRKTKKKILITSTPDARTMLAVYSPDRIPVINTKLPHPTSPKSLLSVAAPADPVQLVLNYPRR